MLTDVVASVSSGSIEGPEPDASILAVVCFVEKHLIEFSDKFTDSEIKNEKGLTQKLVLLLNASKEDRLFFFDKEYMEDPERGNSPQVDIGTITTIEEGIIIESKNYGNDESFFSLEAKRLCKLETKRSKEYLVGRFEGDKYLNTGGVERFKKGIHGKNLNYGALIAYVQENDFNYWYQIINLWVVELILKNIYSQVSWSLEDKLRKEYIETATAKFISVNSRQNDFIRLFHLWVNLVSSDSPLLKDPSKGTESILKSP